MFFHTGYGEIVPVTPTGRMTCIAYAILGIPLTLLLLADIGNLLGSLILIICKYIRPSMVITRIRRDSPCPCFVPSRYNPDKDPKKESRNRGSRGESLTYTSGDGLVALSQTSLNSFNLQTLGDINSSSTHTLSNQTSDTKLNTERNAQQIAKSVTVNTGSNPPSYNQSVSVQSNNSNGIRKDIYTQSSSDSNFPPSGFMQQFAHASTYKDSNPPSTKHHHSLQEAEEVMNMPDEEVVEEVPLSIVVIIYIAYSTIGAVAIKQVETEWDYEESLYFTFITLTTIGFGDYIPTVHYQDGKFMSCLFFTMFGMAVNSMCITLAQAKVLRFCKKMSTKLGF